MAGCIWALVLRPLRVEEREEEEEDEEAEDPLLLLLLSLVIAMRNPVSTAVSASLGSWMSVCSTYSSLR